MFSTQTTNALTVSDLNLYIKTCLENDPVLTDFWVQGEISSLKAYPAKGMVYATLTDGESQINAVIFETYLAKLKFIPMVGQTVRAKGRIGVFHKKGTYSLQIFAMIEVGKGALNQELEQLKLRLSQEGLFDPERKRPLPKYPSKIGLITPENSAALTDFITIKNQFFSSVQLYLIPATVQGNTAISSIINALDVADSTDLDVVVILRGGGSPEDLAYFNDELLVRRIAQSKHPLISAIGHEIDFTLVDFVADFRAATPSNAAHHLAAPFIQLKEWLKRALDQRHHQVFTLLENTQGMIQSNLENAQVTLEHRVSLTHEEMASLTRLAESLNPLRKLSQGFSICTDFLSKATIKSIAQISPDQHLTTHLCDGTVHSQVIDYHVH